MVVRIRPARASSNGRASGGDARPDNRLALVDQGFFAGQRASGQNEVMQILWVYEHPVDLDGLRRLNHNLGYGLLGRLIERSPLPFGRHRWVFDRGPSDIDIAERARPRAELSDWADERLQLSVDPERGPGWHIGVCPLTDGSTAVTIVISHYLSDAFGVWVALVEATMGNTGGLGYPPPHSRTRLRAVVQDAREAARSLPEIARAFAGAARLGLSQWRNNASSQHAPAAAPRSVAVRESDDDETVVVPNITIRIDIDDWDARAKALGGTSHTLAAGLTVKLAERLGRRRSTDGAVTLQIVTSNRTPGDTRAIAVSYVRVAVDPTRVTKDLSDIRAAIKQALKAEQETPDVPSRLTALIPFTPERMWKRGVAGAFNDPDLPVLSSNLGDVPLPVLCPDGTATEYMAARGARQHATRQWLDRTGGQMILLSSRFLGKFVICLQAYQPGAENTRAALNELCARTLAEFDLAGEIS